MEEERMWLAGREIKNSFIFAVLIATCHILIFAVTPIDRLLKMLGKRGFSYKEERLYLIEDGGKYYERAQTIDGWSLKGSLSRRNAEKFPEHSRGEEELFRKAIKEKQEEIRGRQEL